VPVKWGSETVQSVDIDHNDGAAAMYRGSAQEAMMRNETRRGRSARKDAAWRKPDFSRLFPDRQLMLRTGGKVRYFKFGKNIQVGASLVAAAFGGWAAFATVSYFVHQDVVTAKNNEILHSRLVYKSLLSEVSAYQQKFASLTNELEMNHGLMLELVEKNASLKKNLRNTETRLESAEEQRERIKTAREGLRQRLGEIESEMRGMTNRNFELEGNISNTVADLQTVVHERNSAIEQREKLALQVERLQGQITDLHESEQSVLVRLIEQTAANIESVEAVLERTGVSSEKLIAQIEPGEEAAESGEDGENGEGGTLLVGQGGPFIAADNEFKPDESVDESPAGMIRAQLTTLDRHLQRWNELRDLMRRMPLAAPVDYFKISSRFGKRRDPINNKLAVHYGLDFGGVFKSSIFATAPGTVTYAGRNGRYGRMVEIDHGGGVVTRYAHLHKILVNKDDKVDYRHKIGLLGNTGRSTGAHLHYEILVNGKPRDPWLFIKAGSYVYKG
jgi:murein DD-endopeptidase MepM/ murein hydrolase activator NlpD